MNVTRAAIATSLRCSMSAVSLVGVRSRRMIAALAPPVKLTSEGAGLLCERVIDSVWIAPNRPTKKELQ